jgi:hypothetical protein
MSFAGRWSCLCGCARLVAALACGVPGCNKAPSTRPAPASSSDAEAPTPAPQATVPAPAGPAPQDLDIAALSSKLGCGRAPKSKDACRVLKEFGEARRWTWPAESPEGRWAGNAFIVGKDEKGKADKDKSKRVMVLYGKVIPTMQAGVGMLPLKFGAGMLSDALGPARWKLVDGISRMSRVPRKNAALVAAMAFTAETQRSVQATEGASILWVADDKAYFRQQGRKILVVELSADPTAQHGEGTYAELWPVYW